MLTLKLASQAEIVTTPGWVHPYGGLLDPELMCKTILEFLKQVAGLDKLVFLQLD